MAELKGKTLIITGASLGIGRALALELSGLGVNFVLKARHPTPLAEAAAVDIGRAVHAELWRPWAALCGI